MFSGESGVRRHGKIRMRSTMCTWREAGGAKHPLGTRGKMCARFTVLHGVGLGGARSPPMDSPTDMVICVCNLPHWMVVRSPLVDLWVSWGSCGGPEGSGGVLERAAEDPGRFGGVLGAPEKPSFSFLLRGETDNGLMK